MLSVALVRSAAGAASYFAKDDYCAGEHASEVSVWGGKGAAMLGLAGEVGKADFENLLNGRLPDGNRTGGRVERRRAGLDLTFSMPKSASVLAYVAGDDRLLAAHMSAVQQAMGWVEANFAEGRTYTDNPKGDPVRTGNLTYAIFQHDTSRKLDPQAHLHVVIASVTQVAGNWRALHNDQLWANNSLIGSIYHAALRTQVEDLGYATRLTGKHGQFEIEGVSASVLHAFSQRRGDILAKASALGVRDNAAHILREITRRTRDAKINLEDRVALRVTWQERLAMLGFDPATLATAAREAGTPGSEQGLARVRQLGAVALDIIDNVRERLAPRDPLVTHGVARLSQGIVERGTELAVASAIRILGEREAAFPIHEIARTALDLGVRGVTIERVETRVARLVAGGQLILGGVARGIGAPTHATTPEQIADERRLLAGIDAGRGAGRLITTAETASKRLRADRTRPLSGEQEGAAVLALSSTDRMVVIQGVAGAGKTTLIAALAQVASGEGRQVLGLAQANTMVAMLRDDAGVPALTVSAFVNAHLTGALAGKGPAFEASRAALADTLLVLDEASLVANKPMNDLVTIANRLGIDRLVMVGDRAQLQPIEAGKAFSLVQAHGPDLARMETSLRQRSAHMKAVATLTRSGAIGAAFEVLGERVVDAGSDFRSQAAQAWLALSADERVATALYASGRATRAVLNDAVKAGLKSEGVLTGEGMKIERNEALNLAREELRFPHNYQTGQRFEVVGTHRPGGLGQGAYRVTEVTGTGRVVLRDEQGVRHSFRPDRLEPGDRRGGLSLFERETITLHAGERIRWTANDRARGLHNAAEAEVLAITERAVELRISSGGHLLLARDDRMLSRLTLAYAINMHQAQGMTSDRGIGVMDAGERHLSNQRLTHVMATRVRDDLTIYTNDRNRLQRAIASNRGDKASALEVIGEKTVAPPANRDGQPQTGAPVRPVDRADPFAIDPGTLRAVRRDPGEEVRVQLTHLPEKTIELGL